MSETSPKSGGESKPRVIADGLAAARGERVLFENLSFVAAAGDFIEIRGANGVGKTTLLRTLASLAKPSRGSVRVENVEAPELALHLIGHRDGLKPSADALAHLRYWAGLLGGSESAVEFALQVLGLVPIARLPARVLSQGQARRLSLARLLAAPRPIWLLDEPAAGLDAQGKALLAQLITSHRAGGGIVLAAVHEALGPTPSQTLSLDAA